MTDEVFVNVAAAIPITQHTKLQAIREQLSIGNKQATKSDAIRYVIEQGLKLIELQAKQVA